MDGSQWSRITQHRERIPLATRLTRCSSTTFQSASDHKWFEETFNKFGVVKDAFIPRKRRKCSGSKFSFVRYDCHISAGMAISKMNGVWVDNMRLFVKEAFFGHNAEKLKQMVPRFSVDGNRGFNHGTIPCPKVREVKQKKKSNTRAEWRGIRTGKSFAQVVGGEPSKARAVKDSNVILKISSVGNGWLDRSAVVIMHMHGVESMVLNRGRCNGSGRE